MMQPAPVTSQVELTDCDRELIHIPGRIQRFACLFAFSRDWVLSHVSQNVDALTSLSPAELLGRPASEILSPAVIGMLRRRLVLSVHNSTPERVFGQDMFGDGRLFDLAIHESGANIVLEAEPADAGETVEALTVVRSMLQALRHADSLPDFFREAAQQVRRVTEFDRVMVYRFADDGTGEVIAEDLAEGVESYLGLRYPASDIPQPARQLYVKNVFRIIADVSDAGVTIVPERAPDGTPLDLSMSVARAVSPVHLEYLTNMGVAASLSISIVVDGVLWGLFACHHMTARQVAFDKRTATELFAELFSLELANRVRQAEMENAAEVRAVHDKIMSVMSVEGSPFEDLSGNLPLISSLLASDGVAIWIDGEYAAMGTALSRDEVSEVSRFLNTSSSSRVFATDSLSGAFAPAKRYAERVSGLLSIPVSRAPRDYVLFFRREVARAVTWAGNPEKSVTLSEQGMRISPRKSFDAWREIVRDHSAPWTSAELKAAEALRVTILEVILRSIDHTMALRKSAQRTQELLIGELNHRVRNILALIRGVVRQTRGSVGDVDEFAEVLGGRIYALARAHDQLTDENWAGAPLRSLLSNELAAYAPGTDKVVLTGGDVQLSAAAFTNLALVMHEMVTNSVKYGALCTDAGRLHISWRDMGHGRLHIRWREEGGPPVRPPKRRGFGSTIIERAIPFELGGEASIDYALTGVRAEFQLPAEHVEWGPSEDQLGAQAVEEVPSSPSPEQSSVLLVEDNMLIAMDAEMTLRDMGFADVVVASSVASALEALKERSFTYAVLDINLGRETSIPLARELLKTDTHVVFASGYSEDTEMPDELRDIPILNKPYAEGKLQENLLDNARGFRR